MYPDLNPISWRSLLDRERERVATLVKQFRMQFCQPPQFVVLAPGRINLIGEHTDYNGYPVLPAAIDRHVAVAVGSRADSIVQARTSAPGLAPCTFVLEGRLQPGPSGDWGNYVKAAAQLLCARVSAPKGADILVDGTVPVGAGLSSSSALVVGTGLALLLSAGISDLSRFALAEEFASAEQFVGTLSGGMDQACCLLAEEQAALRIDFFPLRVRSVPFPSDYHIAVCHSLVRAEKAGAARTAYNLRVWECSVAARAVAFLLGDHEQALSIDRLADLERHFPSQPRASFLDLLTYHLPDRPMPIDEIARLLNANVESLMPRSRKYAPPLDTPLQLLRRARHVFSEADRVESAEAALRLGQVDSLHRAMRASHGSCRDDYEVSCPELETLVDAAITCGAVGSRLTGAGFGGSTVQLVPTNKLPEFFERIDQLFYARQLPGERNFADYRFAFRPSSGAKVIAID